MLFATAVIWGMMIDAFYNVLRILRQYIKHGSILIGIEDFIFCIITAVVLYMQIFNSNDGIIRWYILFAAAAGIWLHYKTAGRILVKLSGMFANRIKSIAGKISKKCTNLIKRITLKILKKKYR